MEPAIKKRKESPNEDCETGCHVFENFTIGEVLSEQSDRKLYCVQGTFDKKPSATGGKEDDKEENLNGSTDNKDTAVVILEKTTFTKEDVDAILSPSTAAVNTLDNDIYKNYNIYPNLKTNAIKATVVHPATQKHIDKYRRQELFVIRETAENYKDITLPYLKESSFSIQWVYNILEKKAESERIVYEDDDKETGFILLPDLKWDGKDNDSLYLMAVVHRRDIMSLRDLNKSHLPLLDNLLTKGTKAITKKYGVSSNKLRIYIHYQPSYYHFHVHYTHIHYKPPGIDVERAHLLEDIIDNINLSSSYYSDKTLIYSLKADHGLCQKYKEEAGII